MRAGVIGVDIVDSHAVVVETRGFSGHDVDGEWGRVRGEAETRRGVYRLAESFA